MFKCPHQCRRSRKLSPDLFTPYLPGPELILPPPMSVNQTIPIFSVSRSFSNLTSAPSFPHSNPSVAEDLSIGSTTHSVFPSQMDWCGPPGPSSSYAAHIPSAPTVPTIRDPSPGIQKFY